MTKHKNTVEELKNLIFTNNWKDAFQKAIKTADQKGVDNLDEYYDWLDDLVEWVPFDPDLNRRTLYNEICEFYWFLDQPSVKLLQEDPGLSKWMIGFANDWGSFLDTPESAKHIASFTDRPEFKIDDYIENPSGWLTFNQFFARFIKPGKRPIVELCNDDVIVSPADCTPAFSDVISHNKITAKGMSFSILDLLKDSPHQKDFEGGVFMHSFLNVFDYHRFHTPVAGKVLEVRDIPGNVYMDVTKDKTGTLNAQDGTGYQFTQARGLIVLDSPIGKVAILPIGMAQVSSVVLYPEINAILHKGEEFGNFVFGGSDIVTLFSKECDVEITVPTDGSKHCNQGTQIGKVKK